MIVNLSGSSARLVTMEGESKQIRPLLNGIDKNDQIILRKGFITVKEKDYLSKKYPELMGFWPLLLAALPAVATGVSSIISATKGKDTQQNVEASATAALQAQLQAQQAQMEQAAALKAQNDQMIKTLLMVGIPVAAIILVITMKKRK
jgi:uncharacterized protein YceK